MFGGKGLLQAIRSMQFARAQQQVIADNLARLHIPGAQPKTLEMSDFAQTLTMWSTNDGAFITPPQAMDPRFVTRVASERMTEKTPGESQISIEEESFKMAEVDDFHNVNLNLIKSWRDAVKKILG